MAKAKLGRSQGRFTQHRRLEKLQELLTKNPKGYSLYELAAQLGVSVRTTRRYVKEVEKSYDFEKERQRTGAQLWRIPSSELPRKVELRRTQAYALLAARRLFEPLRGSALFAEIEMAIDKLMAFAQRPGRGPNAGLADARLEDRFLYLPHAPKDYQQRTDELDDLFQAVSDLRPLSMLYRQGDRRSEERVTVHPYAMVMHRDSIYAVGYHVEKGEVRTFVLDRMRDTDASATERFELPTDFSIDEYFQGQFGIWRSDEVNRVVVEFDARAAQFVRTRVVHPSQRLEALPGGGIRLTMQVGNLTQVTSWVLEWGARARVVSPPELVELVKKELSEALAAYTKPAVGRRASDRTSERKEETKRREPAKKAEPKKGEKPKRR
ncbi:MAG: transcriptional regulator [Polyangiaceae bacterium]|nr:transcriptional regulator [Polyangiaceae bacterium]MCW5792604.1 transcriptional regulator [Polyangiaceae bacterium]